MNNFKVGDIVANYYQQVNGKKEVAFVFKVISIENHFFKGELIQSPNHYSGNAVFKKGKKICGISDLGYSLYNFDLTNHPHTKIFK